MTNTEMLEKLKNYLEDEYRSEAFVLTRDKLPWWIDDPNESKHCALQRGLGACQFVQYFGVSFEEARDTYETFKKAIEDIVPTKEREVR